MEPAGACAAYEGCGFFPVWMWGGNPIPYFLPRMSRNPEYDALSYCSAGLTLAALLTRQATLESSCYITIETPGSQHTARQIPITASLALALCYLRDKERLRILFTDQIYINQQDTNERSREVGLMGDIYRHSRTVLPWLGPSHEHSDSLVQFPSRPSDNTALDKWIKGSKNKTWGATIRLRPPPTLSCLRLRLRLRASSLGAVPLAPGGSSADAPPPWAYRLEASLSNANANISNASGQLQPNCKPSRNGYPSLVANTEEKGVLLTGLTVTFHLRLVDLKITFVFIPFSN